MNNINIKKYKIGKKLRSIKFDKNEFLVLASNEFVHTDFTVFKILFNGASPNPHLKFKKPGGRDMRKRNIRKDIMLNEIENEKLISDCQKANLSYGEYFRKLWMEKEIKEKPGIEFYEVMKQLSKIGVNLNQIAHKANSINKIDKDYYKEVTDEWHRFAREVKQKFL